MKLYGIYEDSMIPVGWTFRIPLTQWWVRWSRRRLSLQRTPQEKPPSWAKWVTRGGDGWKTYHAQKPKFFLWGEWHSNKGREGADDSYFEEQKLWPEWFWKGRFFWPLMAMFTRRRIRHGRN
jgi:hypothetical protein